MPSATATRRSRQSEPSATRRRTPRPRRSDVILGFSERAVAPARESSMAARRKLGERGGRLSPEKAKKMLRDNSAQGHPLTPKQKGLFGLIAGGGTPSRMNAKRKG